VALPGRTGIELARDLLALSPQLPVLFISGQVGAEVFRYYGIDLTDEHFLAKPFTEKTLLRRVKKALTSQPLVIRAARPTIAATG
jgi:DNA-binding response OmpR family regulator